MVKAKSDYDKRMDDSRFKNFDKVLDPSYGQKQYYILVIGLCVLGVMLVASIATPYMNPSSTETPVLYEEGLNISYIPSEKIISITFSNPNHDTSALVADIQVPFDTTMVQPTKYISAYAYTTTEFPVNISYSPSQKISNINHITLVTLVKETGNYTYTYSVIPDVDNKMWQGTGQYLDKIAGVFRNNETNE